MDLKDYRKLAKISQKELAKRIGKSESFVWYVENNKKKPSGKTARIWAEELKIPVEKVFKLFFDFKSDKKSRNEKTA